MGDKITIKVERYLELSKKFQKSSGDVFGNEGLPSYGVERDVFTWLGGGNVDITTQEPKKEKTRAEKILEGAQVKAKLADEYDEYLQLQKDLGDYFTSLNKLKQ